MNATTALLEVDHVTVSYDGFKALDDLCFSMEPGSVHVLIGPNGAGKSTLLDTIIGRVRPTQGRIVFKGEDISALPEFRIVERGICRKFQTPGVLDELTVEANILVAATRDRRSWRSFSTHRSPAERARVDEVLDIIGLSGKRALPAAQLAHGERQWLEIGMVVASDSALLLLDEPAAGMTHREAGLTAELIRSLAGRHAFIVIDHDMDFVEKIAAPVSVLHMGRMLAHGSVDEMRRDPSVAAVYLGRAAKGADALHP
ncbi:MAG: urea ABC transporter ATP-binding protein UrtD [Candidatus Eremiobacteraeota bacterium]|nr:urea ABC transporter ATP-binding protein UrtD [Candidatus Eremiobacteraeota bacterium]